MKRLYIILLIAMLGHFNSFAQRNKFDTLSNKMFFNVFIHEPDSVVYDFLKKYYPVFTEKSEPGGWTIYPPGPIPIFQNTVHSLVFTEHPFFKAKFREGRFDVLAQEEKNGNWGFRDFHLWFMFDTHADAINGFTWITQVFEPVSKSKKNYEIGDKKIAEYSSESFVEEGIDNVQLILTRDELYEGKYKIFFKIGAPLYPK